MLIYLGQASSISRFAAWRRKPAHSRARRRSGDPFKSPEDTNEGPRARCRLLTQMGPRKGNASAQKHWTADDACKYAPARRRAVTASCHGRSHGSSALHHIQPMAHANSRALSRHTPRAGDKGLGRNGIPKPAGAGGGSSSLSLEPFEGLMRFIHLESTLRLRPERCSRLPFSLRSGACSIEQNQRLQNRINFDDSATIEPAQRRQRSRPHGRRKSTTPGPPSFPPLSASDCW